MEFTEMKQDLWQYLPVELMFNILSRLPIESIIRYKFVCKSWLDLIESFEFCNSTLRNSKPVPGLAFFENFSKICHFYKFVDKHDEQYKPSHERHLSIALKFRLPDRLKHVDIRDSSVNGLLLFSNTRILPHNHFICNPLTRDYIKLPSSSHEQHCEPCIGFGFGVSKMSGEYKIVSVVETKCEVYTLGTGSWRSVAPCSFPHKTNHATTSMFLNGNLHWLLHDDSSSSSDATVAGISCFDLESELFSILSPPPPLPRVSESYSAICTLKDYLAFSHNRAGCLVIWMMKEYGDDKSWIRMRKFIFNKATCVLGLGVVIPIEVFKDGDILFARPWYSRVSCYSKTRNTIKLCNMHFVYGLCSRTPISYTPSLLPLKTFSAENVCSF